MPKKPTYRELQKRVAEFESQQQQQLLTEIANRQLTEEALRQSEARLNQALEIADVGCWEWDIKTGMLLWSEQTYRQMGEQPDRCSPNRENFLQYVHPEDRAAFAIAMDQTLAGRPCFDLEFRIVRPNGGIRILHSRGEVARSPDGLPLCMFGVSTDITERKRAEEALRQSEERYRSLFNNMTEAFALHEIVTDKHGQPSDYRFLEVNAAFEQMTGLKRSDVVNRNVRDVLPGIESFWIETYGRVALTGIPANFEHYYAAPLDHWYDVFAYCPAPRQFAAVFLDISRRKRAEEALRLSEERFSRAFAANPAAIVLSRMEDGLILDVNETWVELLGYSQEEAIGHCARDMRIWPSAEAAQRFVSELKQKGSLRGWEQEFHKKSGQLFEAQLSSQVLIVRGEKLILSTLVDITQRKLAEEALRQSEERFRLALRNAPVSVAAQDLDLRYIWAYNQRTAPPEDIIGKLDADIFTPEEAEHITGIKRRVLADNIEYREQMWLNRPSGRIFLDVCWEPIKDEAGKVVGVGSATIDLTQIKLAEEALARANDELEQRVAERTAELVQRATQLRALAGELTLSEQRERSRLAKVLHDHLQQLLVAAKFRLAVLGRTADDLMKQATKEIEELIDESIASSRSLTAELSPPILHEAGLNAGLEWLARRMAERQGLLVDLELQETGALPEDLKILLFESVRELLFNVAKHAQTRSSAINLRRVDGFLQLTVSDRGVGFDPEVMAKAGESGRGFGLFSVRERLELFGGKLEIQSAPGQGSLVFLSVPITHQTAVQPKSIGPAVFPEANSNDRILTPNTSRKIRVLLADDHAVVRQGIGNLLSDEPDIEIVGSAADGQEAVEFAAKLLPDVILMDMSMPKLNGVEATRIIHNDWPEIRIIGLSMFEEADRAQAMRDAGAVDYITKSGPAEELINLIRTCVRDSNKVLSAKSPS